MNRGTLRITRELLVNALKLPVGTIIDGIDDDRIARDGIIDIHLIEASLPDIAEGAESPIVSPVYVKEYGEFRFEGWEKRG